MVGWSGLAGRGLAALGSSLKGALRSKKALYLSIAIIVILALIQLKLSYDIASTSATYRSDEVWYVSSARNILREVLKTEVSYRVDGYEVYTVFADDYLTLMNVKSIVYKHGGIIVKDDYTKINAIAIGLKGEEGLYEIKSLEGVRAVVRGFPYPDASNIDGYLNFEHPPLGKYLIGLSMKMCGDTPICWRLPSVVSSFIITLSVGLISLRIFGPLGGVISSLVALIDPLTTNMGSVAMLDIYLAMFTALGLLMIALNRDLPAALMFALAFNVKFSGLFLAVGLYIYLRLKKQGILRSLYMALLPLAAVSALIYFPYISSFGPERMLSELVGAVKWHTTSRPEGPVASNPIDWVLGLKPFYLAVNPDITARGPPWIYVPAFAGMILLLPALSGLYRFKVDDRLKAYSILAYMFFAQYFAIMMLGNRTLYSFYFVNFSPLAYILFVKFADILFLNQSQMDESLSIYKLWASQIIRGEISWIPIPRELAPLLPTGLSSRKDRRLAVMTGVVLLLSLLLHLPYASNFRLYSDIPYVLHEAPGVEPGRILGFQGLLVALLRNLGGSDSVLLLLDIVFGYAALNELIIFVRRVSADTKMRPALFSYPMLLSLLIYTGYDGTTISLFLFTLAINLILENREALGAIVLGLSSGNPMILLVNGLLVSYTGIKHSLLYVATVFGLMLGISHILGASLNDYAQTLLSFYASQKTASYYSFFHSSKAFLLGTLISLACALYIMERLSGRSLSLKLSASLLAFTALYPNFLPQWGLLLILIYAASPIKFLGRLMLLDLFNALIIVTWFSNSYLMQELFKYPSQSPLEPYSLPTIMYILRAFAAITILIPLIYTYGRGRHASGEAGGGEAGAGNS